MGGMSSAGCAGPACCFTSPPWGWVVFMLCTPQLQQVTCGSRAVLRVVPGTAQVARFGTSSVQIMAKCARVCWAE